MNRYRVLVTQRMTQEFVIEADRAADAQDVVDEMELDKDTWVIVHGDKPEVINVEYLGTD